MNYLGESIATLTTVEYPLSEADQLELDQITKDVSDNLILTNGLIANGIIKTNNIEPVDTSLVLRSLSASKKITIDGTTGTTIDGDLKCNNNQTTVGHIITERLYTDQIYAKDYNINLNNNVILSAGNTLTASLMNSASLALTSTTNATIDTPELILTGSLKTNQIIDPTSITLTTPSTILTGGLTTTSLATNLITDATLITLDAPETKATGNLTCANLTCFGLSSVVSTLDITASTALTLTGTTVDIVSPETDVSGNLVVNGTAQMLNGLTVTGDLTVTGTNTILNTIEINVDDPIINVANDHLETTQELMGMSCAGVYALLKHPQLGWMLVKNENGILKTDLDTSLTTYGEIDDDLTARQYQFQNLNVGAIRNLSTTEAMRLNVITVGDRDALIKETGTVLYNKTSNAIEYYTGEVWRAVQPAGVLANPDLLISTYVHGQTFVSNEFMGQPAYSLETRLIYLCPNTSYAESTYYRIQTWDNQCVAYTHGLGATGNGGSGIVYTNGGYNKLVIVPQATGNQVEIIDDDITGTITKITGPSSWGNSAYHGGSFDGNRVIFHPYMMSNNATWHGYNCDTNAVFEISNTYSGTITANLYRGGCYHKLLDRVYLSPHINGTWDANLHYIDCSTYTVVQFAHIVTSGVGFAYMGGVYHDLLQRIYLIPYAQSSQTIAHYIDEFGDYNEYTWVSPTASTTAYIGGAYNPLDKCIYFTPYGNSSSATWHRINASGVCETYSHTDVSQGATAYSGSVLAGSSIYLQPYSASSNSEWPVIRPFETDVDTSLILIPQAPMTGATTGNYTVSSSTMYSPFLSWRVFNHNVSWDYAGDTTGYLSNAGYDTGNGASTGAFSTVTVNNGTLNGAWVDLHTSSSTFNINAYQIFVFDDQPHNRFPRIVSILTSTDNGANYYDGYRSPDLGLQTSASGSPAGTGSVVGSYWTYNSTNQTLSTPIMYITETNGTPYAGLALDENLTNIRFVISQISTGEDKTHFCEIRLYGNIN